MTTKQNVRKPIVGQLPITLKFFIIVWWNFSHMCLPRPMKFRELKKNYIILKIIVVKNYKNVLKSLVEHIHIIYILEDWSNFHRTWPIRIKTIKAKYHQPHKLNLRDQPILALTFPSQHKIYVNIKPTYNLCKCAM